MKLMTQTADRAIEIDVSEERRACVRMDVLQRNPDLTVITVHLDENHAGALVLALQAAIAEVQARAVSL